MSDFPIHAQAPSRRAVAAQTRYSLYRDNLRQDFVGACGYCGDDDERADRSTFHIDHFAPKKHFPQLELDYKNLVYACRFCNVSKSDHWVGNEATVHNNGTEGFVDPCSVDYDTHLRRDKQGRIVPQSALGAYIISRLNLGLIRHELLWRARRARALRDDIQALIGEFQARGKQPPEYANLLQRFFDLTNSIDDYELRAVHR